MERGNKTHIWPSYVLWISYLSWAFLLFTIIWDLYNVPSRSLFWAGELSLLLFIFFMFKKRIPGWAYLGILAIFIANVFGEIFLGLFYIFPRFDKVIHLLSPLAICAFLYFLLEHRVPDKKMRLLFSASILLSFELMWEILEYFFDQIFHTVLQGVAQIGMESFNTGPTLIMPRFQDTIYDMALNLVGAVLFLITGRILISRKH